MTTSVRRNVAHLTPAERDAFVQAVRQIDLVAFSDGVSYWDKQDQIHQGTHNHGGPSFIPWHRELCNRFEKLLQQVDPDVALHYWDWTEDPRAADDGSGGTTNLCTDTFFGTASGTVAGVLAPLHNGGTLAGSRDATGNPADPPRSISRNCAAGAPGVPADVAIIQGADALPQVQQWPQFRVAVEGAHDTAHVFFGPGSTIRNSHSSFEDPFVFLLHSNVDRLFAMWQTRPGFDWRLDPDQVYGSETSSTGLTGILQSLQPWDGTVEFGASIPPWTAGSTDIVVKNSRHPSVVRPPCYDTLPLTTAQVAPMPSDPMRFLDVEAGGEQTARALRLRVRGCRQVTCQASLAGDPAFTLLAPSVLSPEPQGFEIHDVLVWVLFTPGAAGSTPAATLTVTVPETGDTYGVPIEASVIAKPTVATSLVLDRSGSMDSPSGVASLARIEVLRNAAPLFVHLLDDADGIGVVRFDTDASVAAPIGVAGGQIAGVGRNAALQAIGTHATNPAGLTAIGDGIEAAANQLAAAGFDRRATVVFTDGHETASKTVAEVTDLINSRLFAIGLGTADQLDPGTLNDIVNGSDGYLLLTGNAGPDDQILLQKYFAQVIAGVTNTQIVVDPEGRVPPGGKAAVPYDLTDGDTRSDVIVLSPYADALAVVLQAPDGTSVDETNGATVVEAATYQTLRLPLPAPAVPGPSAGRWHAVIGIDERRLRKHLARLEERQQLDELARLRIHGVPFTLTVQARSSVRMRVAVAQPSRRPGTVATVIATLTQAGIPLAHSAVVRAEVTAPDGSAVTVPLAEVGEGVYRADVATPFAGVYRVLVRAEGATLGGQRFTREELRTLAVWSRGDDRPAPVDQPTGDRGGDVCELLKCLLSSGALDEAAKRAGVDLDSVRKCVDHAC